MFKKSERLEMHKREGQDHSTVLHCLGKIGVIKRQIELVEIDQFAMD